MKKGKNILIFVLINIIVIATGVVIPAIPAYKAYSAYHLNIPKVGKQSFAQNIGDVLRETDTYEARVAFNDAMWWIDHNRAEMFIDGFTFAYVMLGMLVGISVFVIGLILRYKCKNTIYSKAFITAGVLVVILYIYFLSILLQKNVAYTLWSY